MKGTILLNYNDDTHKVEEEEKNRFLKDLLDQMGVSVDAFWPDDNFLSIDQRAQLRNILTTYSIQVIDDLDGHLKIYVDKELVAEWHKCTYKLKRDLSEIDLKKQLYLEMEINCWSVFEE